MEQKVLSKKIRFAVYFQIVLMIGMTISFAYLLNESSKNGDINEIIIVKKENGRAPNIFLKALSIFNKIAFKNNFVSALTQQESGVYTCPKDKNGSICQEYPAAECADKCAEQCLPTTSSQSAVCKPGTCYNSAEGTCQVGATKGKCELDGGKWFDDPFGNLPQCKQGCCILGDQAHFATKQQCNKDSAFLGLKVDFKSEITTELECIILSKSQEEGACVFENEFQNTCKYTTKSNCQQNLKGKFYSGLLCSNTNLKTNCIAQQKIKCVDGKDEVYWFDSCGNQENIYDSDKLKSFNDGKILSKSESCSLTLGNNLLANQKTCGNCNYLLGSICGLKTTSQYLSDSNSDVVCRDLSCVDESGKIRKHGESWCIYQGSIGTDKGAGGFLRATDTVGSRNFRKVCIDGEVRTEPCSDYRNEICVQSDTDIPNGKFSSAACRINRAYSCYEYNTKNKTNQCEKNPDCFIKHVEIDKYFKFDMCVPKYTPGFNLETRPESAATICGMASQKCEVIYVKGLGGWECKGNCKCETAAFAEQMNDFCTSLGDCGTKANYIGDLTKNGKVFQSGKKKEIGKELNKENGGFSNQYINGIIKYASTSLFKGKYIQAVNISAFYGELGIPGTLGQAPNGDPSAAFIQMASQTSGMVGTGLMAATYAVGYFSYSIGSAGSIASTIEVGNMALGPTLAAAGGALAGAAIAAGVISFLFQITGVGAGLPPELVYATVATGAVAGAIIGANLMASAGSSVLGVSGASGTLFGGFATGAGGALAPMAAAAAVAWILIAAIIIMIVVMMLIGIGQIKKIYYTFQCNPWQAPTGGDKCGQCGKDGMPCSQYSCNALGQTCQFINEETGNAECVSISSNDVNSPVISPNKNLLPSGYTAEEYENGVNIKSSEPDGCINNAYSAVPFGINLDEPGQCVMSNNHTASFDEMDESLSVGLFLRNHSLPLMVTSLNDLGLDSFNPDARADFDIYLRCQDKNGNKNDKEYLVNYCIKPGNDTTPPVVIARDPILETIGFDVTNLSASVFTNEPADCKWDLQDQTYNQMQNNFTCLNDFEQRELYGWRCLGEFPISSNNESLFYVRCLDQPWENDSTKRNANTQGYQFKFNRVANPLKIDSINVDNQTFSFSSEQNSIEVIVKTSGGLDGVARCGYVWGNTLIDFMNTWSLEHKQVFQTLFPGNINLTIKCEDIIGNTAEKTANFKVIIDKDAPIVTRAYLQSDLLKIITDEDSLCYYSINQNAQCLFNIENASMMNGENMEHTLPFIQGKVYYVKCKDNLNHYPGNCNIIIRGGNYAVK